MQVGKYTYGASSIRIHFPAPGVGVKIGAFCSIAAGCNVYLAANHRTDWISTFPFGHIHQQRFPAATGVGPKSNGSVVVGNDVWIGSNVTIMSGVHIGDGAVLAANTHVVKDVAPYAIVGGNPSRLLKFRFSDEQIAGLLAVRWWDWDDAKINEECATLCSSNLDAFLAKHMPK